MPKAAYHVIPSFLSPEVCALLADYVRFKAKRRPNIRKKHDPLNNIHREYGDAAMDMLLEKLTPRVEQALGVSLWPTLSFCYLYTHGNQLLRHNDRSSCEWVAGLCLGVDEPYKQRHGSWPLNLRLEGQTEAIKLDVGDLVIFRGSSTEHWRDRFTGEWFVSAIFAYVEKEGRFAFQKFDQRRALGLPHVGMFHWTFGCLKHKLLDKTYRFHLPTEHSPTRVNLINTMQAAGFKATRWQRRAQFCERHLNFSPAACELLEFKHTLARLMATHAPTLMPTTYVVDDDTWPAVLNRVADQHYMSQSGLVDCVPDLAWILKPSLLNNGQAIMLFDKLTQIEAHFVSSQRVGGPHVLQQYVVAPDLHQGRKYSLRYFVVMTRNAGVYLYRHGYLNVALAPYVQGDYASLKPHVTNEHLQAGTCNVEQIPTQLQPEAEAWYQQVKAMVAGVAKALHHAHPEAFVATRDDAFAVFGFDVMLDAAQRMWLLELNHGPCFPTVHKHPLQKTLYADFWQAMLQQFIRPMVQQRVIEPNDHADFECIVGV